LKSSSLLATGGRAEFCRIPNARKDFVIVLRSMRVNHAVYRILLPHGERGPIHLLGERVFPGPASLFDNQCIWT
jgi:hypothetical protein